MPTCHRLRRLPSTGAWGAVAPARASLLALLLSTGVLCAPSHADPFEPPFATLDRIGDGWGLATTIGVSNRYEWPRTETLELNVDLYGHLLLTESLGLHLGAGFFSARRAVSGWEDTFDGTTIPSPRRAGLVNPRVGAHWVWRSGDFTLPVAAGVTLPLASDDPVDRGPRTAAMSARMLDSAITIPGAVGRLAVTPRYTRGRLHLRADTGLDVWLEDPEAAYLRLGAGLAVRLGPVALLGEAGAVLGLGRSYDAGSLGAGVAWLDLPVRPSLHVSTASAYSTIIRPVWFTLGLTIAEPTARPGG